MQPNEFELDLSNIPRELRLILRIIVMNVDFLKREEFVDIDWKQFMQLANHHRIYPVLYKKVKEYNNGFIPHHVIQNLAYLYRRNTFNMLYLSSEMENVSKLFTEENVPVLFLKGPVIGHYIYGDISLRTSSDLDFLVPIKDLGKAETILESIGYEKEDYIVSVLNDWKWRHHHVTYFHPQKKLKLEIHWRLHPGPGVEPKFQDLWKRKIKSKLTSYPVYFLGKEDLFLFLAAHGARHGWSRIRWLYDIHKLAEQSIDWIKVNKQLRRYQFHHAGAQALVLSSELFHTKITESIKPIIKNSRAKALAQEAIFYLERIVNLHTDPVPEEVFSYHSRHLFSLMTKRQKLMYFLSIVHPFAEDAEAFPLPQKLHFLYFPLRPFIVILRRKRKHAIF